MGAMPVEGWRAVIGVGVPAIHIVREAVALVIQAIAGNLTRVGPFVGHQVRMVQIHAAVHHGHHNVPPQGIRAAGGHIPGLRGIHIGVRDLLQVPHLGELRVVRLHPVLGEMVRLGPAHLGQTAKRAQALLHATTVRQRQQEDVQSRHQDAAHLPVLAVQQGAGLFKSGGTIQAHQHMMGVPVGGVAQGNQQAQGHQAGEKSHDPVFRLKALLQEGVHEG